MVSAERVLAYCKVPQEANLDSEPENKPPDDWPSKGDIEVSRGRTTCVLVCEKAPSIRLTVLFYMPSSC